VHQTGKWNENGFIPLDDNFLDNVVSLLEISKKNNIQIIFTMFSFECTDPAWDIGNYCRRMFTEPRFASSYIQNGFTPFMKKISDSG